MNQAARMQMYDKTAKRPGQLKAFLSKKAVLLIFLVFIIVVAVIKPSFIAPSNLQNIFMDISIYGVVACGMTIALLCGEFDLSVSSQFMWAQIFFVTLVNVMGPAAAILLTLFSGAVLGSINGLLVTFGKISSFITTLGTMTIYEGMCLIFTDGNMVSTANEAVAAFGNMTLFGVSVLTWIFIAAVILFSLIMKYSAFGRRIYATGGNIEAAKLAGIKTRFYKYIIFVILGLCAAVAGIMFVTMIRAGSTLYGTDLAMTAVAAAVIGGTSLSGGRGTIIGTFIGMLIIGTLYKTLIYLGMQAYYQNLIKGAVLLVVVVMDVYTQHKNAARRHG